MEDVLLEETNAVILLHCVSHIGELPGVVRTRTWEEGDNELKHDKELTAVV